MNMKNFSAYKSVPEVEGMQAKQDQFSCRKRGGREKEKKLSGKGCSKSI